MPLTVRFCKTSKARRCKKGMILRFPKAILPLALLPVLAGCMDAQSCDPNTVGNVLSSAACSSGGHFEARQAHLRVDLAKVEAEVTRERTRLAKVRGAIRQAEAEGRLTAAQQANIDREMAALSGAVDTLARTADPARAARTRAEIQERQARINGYMNLAVF